MRYTKRRFGAELILELEKGFNIQKLSKWADYIDYNHEGELEDEELQEIIRSIGAMSLDPQFEYTEEQLLGLGLKLIKG
jgi:hypothetical protein